MAILVTSVESQKMKEWSHFAAAKEDKDVGAAMFHHLQRRQRTLKRESLVS